MANSRRNYLSSSYLSGMLKTKSGEYEKLFIALTVFYLINETFLKEKVVLFRNHFNDLLAIPLLLSYSGVLIEKVAKKKISIKLMIGLTIISSFIWEYITPKLIKGSTGDWLDVLAYFMGLIVFIWIERRNKGGKTMWKNSWSL